MRTSFTMDEDQDLYRLRKNMEEVGDVLLEQLRKEELQLQYADSIISLSEHFKEGRISHHAYLTHLKLMVECMDN